MARIHFWIFAPENPNCTFNRQIFLWSSVFTICIYWISLPTPIPHFLRFSKVKDPKIFCLLRNSLNFPYEVKVKSKKQGHPTTFRQLQNKFYISVLSWGQKNILWLFPWLNRPISWLSFLQVFRTENAKFHVLGLKFFQGQPHNSFGVGCLTIECSGVLGFTARRWRNKQNHTWKL